MYKTTIGIELHCELLTKSKMFAKASSDFEGPANENVDDASVAFPGTMPTINEKAIALSLQACKLLDMEIDKVLKFDRKCYFYSDNPKNFQITQFHFPIGKNGKVLINDEKTIGIERLHIEEDTAKQVYKDDKKLINYNRSGNPLIEIVSRPEMHSGQEAADYVNAIKMIFEYGLISDAKMEQGSLRCDVNISISKTDKLGTKVEVKNLNSTSNIIDAVKFEFERQKELLENNKEVIEETRRWDEGKKATITMRSKDNEDDFIYLPEPNIPPITITDSFIKKAMDEMPLTISEIKEKLNALNVGNKQINKLLQNKEATFIVIEKATTNNVDKLVKLLLGDIASYVNSNDVQWKTLNTNSVIKMLELIEKGSISSKHGKELIDVLFTENDIEKEIDKRGFVQNSNTDELKNQLKEIIENNKHMLDELETRRQRVEKFFIGQLMKESKGQANPQLAMQLLNEILGDLDA